ncbi:MAG: hypothetical protein U5L45_24240 [Saprospiraceae bacterium]|nr:hypothetical protein [Saprospiraceae bacterium]
MWFVFRLRRKTNHIPLPRASKMTKAEFTSIIQKNRTLLMPKIPSQTIKPKFCVYLNYYTLLLASLAKEGEVVRFSGFARKTNHISSHARAKRAKRIRYKKCIVIERLLNSICQSIFICLINLFFLQSLLIL